MDIDPMDLVEMDDPEPESEQSRQEKSKSRLNTAVAISVALLATFIAVCKIKDHNIVQAMQQAQASSIDDWSYYQALNIRSEIARSTATQLQLQAASKSGSEKVAYDKQIQVY